MAIAIGVLTEDIRTSYSMSLDSSGELVDNGTLLAKAGDRARYEITDLHYFKHAANDARVNVKLSTGHTISVTFGQVYWDRIE